MHTFGRLTALATVLGLAALPAVAAPRSWKSTDGTRTFDGDYVTHDAQRVTIRRADGRVFTLDIGKLHADDRAWLSTQQAASTDIPPPAAAAAVFDTLCLGDSYNDVQAKLKASQAVELTIAETYLARMGLNGSYRTKQQIGGLHCRLSFDWTKDFHLRELILQTEPQPTDLYNTSLAATWNELIILLSALHGPPASIAGYPAITQLSQDGMMLGSHLWRTEGGASAVLGTARDAGRYSVAVRFTTASIQPSRAGPDDMIPPPAPAGG